MSAAQIAQLRMIGESAATFAPAHGGSVRARRVHEGALAWDAAPRRAQRLALVLQVACLLTAFATDVMFWSGRYERHPLWRTPVVATGTPR